MKRILAILLVVFIFGSLVGFILYDFIAHADGSPLIDRIAEYVVHIVICLVTCTILHNPAHKFAEWLKKSIGINNHKGHEDGDCH